MPSRPQKSAGNRREWQNSGKRAAVDGTSPAATGGEAVRQFVAEPRARHSLSGAAEPPMRSAPFLALVKPLVNSAYAQAPLRPAAGLVGSSWRNRFARRSFPTLVEPRARRSFPMPVNLPVRGTLFPTLAEPPVRSAPFLALVKPRVNSTYAQTPLRPAAGLVGSSWGNRFARHSFSGAGGTAGAAFLSNAGEPSGAQHSFSGAAEPPMRSAPFLALVKPLVNSAYAQAPLRPAAGLVGSSWRNRFARRSFPTLVEPRARHSFFNAGGTAGAAVDGTSPAAVGGGVLQDVWGNHFVAKFMAARICSSVATRSASLRYSASEAVSLCRWTTMLRSPTGM